MRSLRFHVGLLVLVLLSAPAGKRAVAHEGEGAEALGGPWNSATAAPECKTANNSEWRSGPTSLSLCTNTSPWFSWRYTEYPGGPACGWTHFFCDGPETHQGCYTEYYSYVYWCQCP